MLKLTNPRLRRNNVVFHSVASCVSNTSKEFSRTPEVSFWKNLSQPRMLSQKAKRTVSLKQLKGFANTYSRRKLNKKVDVINSDVQLINFESSSVSYLPKKELAIHPNSIEFQGVSCIFNFPHEVECVLSKAMFSGFEIHFLSPKSAGDKAHANLTVYFEEPSIQALLDSQPKELNLMEHGDSSPSLKSWVSSPSM